MLEVLPLLAFGLWSCLCWGSVQPILRRDAALAQWPGFYWLLGLVCSLPLWPVFSWQANWIVPPRLLLDSFSQASHWVGSAHHAELPNVVSWSEPFAVAIWSLCGLGVSVRLWQLGRQWRHLQHLAAVSTPLSITTLLADFPESLRTEATAAFAHLQRHQIQLRQQQAATSPFVFGCWRLYLILPSHFQQLAAEDRWLMLQHELCHIQRRDPQQLLLWRLLGALCWFNPVLSRLERAFIRAMELTVDQQVLAQQPTLAYRYGQVLLRCLKSQQQTCSPQAGFAQHAAEDSFYRQRLFLLFQPVPAAAYGQRRWWAAAILLLVCLVHLFRSQWQLFPSAPLQWQWPLQQVTINSAFGVQSALRQYRPHTGLDLDGNSGDLVMAAAAGTVLVADSHSLHANLGHVVLIDHGDGYQTLYAHLQQSQVRPGQHIAAGAPIGLVGSTGKATGPHLHFELLHDGQAQDPRVWLPQLVGQQGQ